MTRGWWLPAIFFALAGAAGAEDEIPPIERRLPPAGIELGESVRTSLEKRLTEFESLLEGREEARGYADVAVIAKALGFALRHGEFYKEGDAAVAEAVLAAGAERAAALAEGRRPWIEGIGPTVAGYRSSIDGSLQPYGLEIPEGLDAAKPARLYVWLHGRGDTKTDLHFIHERLKKPGTFSFGDGIVLHPFGRQCIGWKSAGEIDVLEAIADVSERFAIDADRIALMGFSMGGAGAWHLGAHFAQRWAVVHAGAGFAETARYQNLAPADFPAWYEQKLWGVYDVPACVRNLFNLPVIAYSGEQDKQIQAARIMEEAYVSHGKTLPHVIGPGMGHKYHPDSMKQVAAFVKEALDRGRNRFAKKVSLQTQTLRYPRVHWVEVTGLEAHWTDARVDAELVSDGKMAVTTRNVRSLRLHSPWEDGRAFPAGFGLEVDGQSVSTGASARELVALKDAGRWAIGGPAPPTGKRPGLTGPIDDAFLSPFLVVLPSGESKHPAVQRWVEFEAAHLLRRWSEVFRGEARVMRDVEVTEDDRRQYNLILWGDPDSNALIREYLSKWGDSVPQWTAGEVRAGAEAYAADRHVLAMIHPAGGESERYVVFNSGPTFREAHDRTNSLQNPKLPDWAVINLDRLPDAEAPGEIVAADFFDEEWKLKR